MNDVMFRRINGRIVPIRKGNPDKKAERQSRKAANQTLTTGFNAGRSMASGATFSGLIFAGGSRWETMLRKSIKTESKDLSRLVGRLNKAQAKRPRNPGKKPPEWSEYLNDPPPDFGKASPIFDERVGRKTRRRAQPNTTGTPDLESIVKNKQKMHPTRRWQFTKTADQIKADKAAIRAAKENINFLRGRANFLKGNLGKVSLAAGAAASVSMFGYLSYKQITGNFQKGKK